MEHPLQSGKSVRSLLSFNRQALFLLVLSLTACGGGGDSGPEVITPLSTPMALVVNQDDTTLTTLRLDGKGSPVIGTLSLGPTQSDAIGGVTFSLGEWIFVTHTTGNRVAYIDPIGSLAPILENYLVSTTDPRIGLQPKRIYRDSVDKEVLWAMNEGDDLTCPTTNPRLPNTSTVSILHNSHIAVGGERPHILKTSCLYGKGEQFAAFSMPTAAQPNLRQSAFISSKSTGIITQVTADPLDGGNRWATGAPIFLCDNAQEQVLGHPSCGNPLDSNHSAPAGMFWSQATGKIYSYLSGYGTIVEIDPDRSALVITRTVDVMPPSLSNTLWQSVGITPNGRFLFLAGEDVISDSLTNPTNAKVLGKLGIVDLTALTLSVQAFSIPQLDNVRLAHFQFAPDGRRLYFTQSNKISDLPFAAQAHNLKLDKLLVFDPSTLGSTPPSAPSFVAEIDLPPVGETGLHGMDLWITGPQGAGSAKGVVVTNATPGATGSASLIDAATNTVSGNVPVGRNPKQVTVYYVGLAASDNQATPIW